MKKIILLITILPLFAQAESNPHFEFYGRLKSTYIYANRSLSSFGNLNLSAPTAAAPGSIKNYAYANNELKSFQMAQSRLGLNLKEDRILGNMETDFISFTKSTPGVQAMPRIRRAFVDYKVSDEVHLRLGQDWDTFSPGMPDTLNYVGLNFNAGNVGFMREQFKANYTAQHFFGELSLGFPARNSSAEVNDMEYAQAPTLAVDARYVNGKEYAGLSLLGAQMRRMAMVDENAWGADLYFKRPGTWSFEAELYAGQNLSKLGTLAMAQDETGKIHHEVGAHANVAANIQEIYTATLGYGRSQVTHSKNVSPFVYNNATQAITSNGMLWNERGYLYLKADWVKRLSVSLEISRYHTKYVQSFGEELKGTTTVESGLYYVF